MMLRLLGMIVILGLFLVPAMAQDEELTGYEIALERIEEARVSEATRLDLSGLGLTELPPELFTLTNLLELALYNNRLTYLSPEIGNLSNLMHLYLWDNQLTRLPVEIGNLNNLYLLLAEGNPIIFPPRELLTQGTPAIQEYLRNEAWWHLQRLIAGGAGFVGLVAAIVLGIRWRNRTYEKKKKG